MALGSSPHSRRSGRAACQLFCGAVVAVGSLPRPAIAPCNAQALREELRQWRAEAAAERLADRQRCDEMHKEVLQQMRILMDPKLSL